jgi:hypothetical protein
MHDIRQREQAMDRNRQQQGNVQNDHRGDASQWRGGTGSQQQGGQNRQQQGGQNRPQWQQGGQRQGRQQSQQGGGEQQFGARQLQSMAEVALRGTALLWDLQMETARNMWRTQARTAAMLGIPDCSNLFEIGNDRARRLFTTSAEQMLHSARQARETVVEMQRQIGRLAEQQTIGITEEVRGQIEQISRHTEQGLQQIKQIAASEADQAEDLTQQSSDYGDDARHPHEQSQAGAGVDASIEQAGADRWEPRFEPTPSTANGAAHEAGEAENAGEEHSPNAGRPQRETRRGEERSRARR